MGAGMKIKVDHITNSSSASFTILKKYLSQYQMDLILNHIEESHQFIIHRGPQTEIYNSPGDAWQITETDDTIEGWTSMDNFDMSWFLEKIGVEGRFIEWDHS